MSTMRDFFRKYHAAPATDGGIDWANASDEVLIAWFTADAALIRKHELRPVDRAHVRERFGEAAAEIWRRIVRLAAECGSQPADWPGRNRVGRLLSTISVYGGDLLEVRPV